MFEYVNGPLNRTPKGPMGQRLAWVFPKAFLRIATNSYKGLYTKEKFM